MTDQEPERVSLVDGFAADMGALMACDACVYLLPCGRSASLELGWAAGAGKRTIVLAAPTLDEPELMVLMADAIALNVQEVVDLLAEWDHHFRADGVEVAPAKANESIWEYLAREAKKPTEEQKPWTPA
jgi:hypothetical protein